MGNTVLIVRENWKKHPILISILDSIDEKELTGVYDIRKIHDLRKILKTKKQKNIITTDPIVFILSLIFFPRGRRIFNSGEMFELQTFNKGKNIFRNALFKYCHYIALKLADTVIFPNKARYRFYLLKKWVSKEKCIIIENFPSENNLNLMNKIKNIDRTKLKIDFFKKFDVSKNLMNKKLFMYAGTLGKEREISKILNLFKENKEYVLMVAGNDKDGIFENINFDNIIFCGELIKEDALKLIWISDFQIAYYSTDLINTRFCAPVKVYESVFFNTPLVVNNTIGIRSLSVYHCLVLYDKLEDLNLSNIMNKKESCEGLIRPYNLEIKAILK